MTTTTLRCTRCGEFMHRGYTEETCIGYFSPPGHNHDDNCIRRRYSCPSCKYSFVVSKRRRCSNPDCNWAGKEQCFCHEGKKVDKWPDE